MVKVFLSKIDKRLLDLALPKIIMDFGGRTTLAGAFAMVDQCVRPLYQHHGIDFIILLDNSSKSRKVPIHTARLADPEADNTYYCWCCGHACHAKNECPSKQKQA